MTLYCSICSKFVVKVEKENVLQKLQFVFQPFNAPVLHRSWLGDAAILFHDWQVILYDCNQTKYCTTYFAVSRPPLWSDLRLPEYSRNLNTTVLYKLQIKITDLQPQTATSTVYCGF